MISVHQTRSEPVASALEIERRARRELLTRLVDKAGELLPAQGPITAFVFLNTLQALEDLPFHEGVQRQPPAPSAASPT